MILESFFLEILDTIFALESYRIINYLLIFLQTSDIFFKLLLLLLHLNNLLR